MEQQPRLPLWFLVANWALVVGALAVGWTLGSRHIADLPEPQNTALQLVYNEILKAHVDPQDGQELLDHAIAGMVKGLDPYSQYVAPSEVRAYDEANTGHYEGIGVRLDQHGDDMVIYYPFPDGPAERAGVLPGDRILAVDGHELAAMPQQARQQETARLVRGPADTEVRLRLARDDGAAATQVELTVRRGGVQQASTKWVRMLDAEAGLGYVYVSDFHKGVAREIDEAIASLGRTGDRTDALRGLVIDLRFDGGGVLDECVAIARSFIGSGTIVSQRRRGSEVIEAFDAKPELCRFPDLPLVVLVNEGSASASEVLAGALQDHGRAAIVGVRSYGKGYVNTVYSWKDFRLKLTTGQYFTPNGRSIDRHHRPLGHGGASNGDGTPPREAGGIEPDVEVRVTKEQREAIGGVLSDFEPPARYLAAFTAVAEKYGAKVPGPPQAATDPQLEQALATLRERVRAQTGATAGHDEHK
ncbi:MAG TPA: S41 family peptidase [Planctomycetota bacterium]|nr:S41 family peptidase [Planctomycetota bacterium]